MLLFNAMFVIEVQFVSCNLQAVNCLLYSELSWCICPRRHASHAISIVVIPHNAPDHANNIYRLPKVAKPCRTTRVWSRALPQGSSITEQLAGMPWHTFIIIFIICRFPSDCISKPFLHSNEQSIDIARSVCSLPGRCKLRFRLTPHHFQFVHANAIILPIRAALAHAQNAPKLNVPLLIASPLG